jgi:hypothetical protein
MDLFFYSVGLITSIFGLVVLYYYVINALLKSITEGRLKSAVIIKWEQAYRREQRREALFSEAQTENIRTDEK